MNPLLLPLLIICTTLTASADWGPLPLKSLVEHSDCIVVAEFVSENSRKTEGKRTDQEVTLKVTSFIKGETPEQINVAGYEDPGLCKAQFIFPTTKDTKYLLFLQKRNDSYSVLNGIYGALTLTDNKVNWFTDETQMENIEQRKLNDLDAVIQAIKHAIETTTTPPMTEAQAIEVLMKVDTFGFGGKEGQKERASDTAFQTLLSSPTAKEKFTALFKDGTTASKLYALCALHSIDPPTFQNLSKSIKTDEMIFTQNGCVVGEEKVSDIINTISKGNYDDFSKPAK